MRAVNRYSNLAEIELRPVAPVDRPREIFAFLRDAVADGQRCALVTLAEITDGASRALGAHMAVTEDGRYCGYVSGGCIEAAVAREALEAIAEDADRVCRLGKGSPFFDIVLPCGGGLSLTIHVLREAATIDHLLDEMVVARKPVSLVYDPGGQRLSVRAGLSATGWEDDRLVTTYRPDPRIFLAGKGIESRVFSDIATAAGLEIVPIDADDIARQADGESAIVLLHHDIEKELPVLRHALASPAFYIGCLGGRRTHANRRQRLLEDGHSPEQLDRIRAPIGLFGPAREARSLAVSVLAEIMSVLESRRP